MGYPASPGHFRRPGRRLPGHQRGLLSGTVPESPGQLRYPGSKFRSRLWRSPGHFDFQQYFLCLCVRIFLWRAGSINELHDRAGLQRHPGHYAGTGRGNCVLRLFSSDFLCQICGGPLQPATGNCVLADGKSGIGPLSGYRCSRYSHGSGHSRPAGHKVADQRPFHGG
ncbi:MAG: hypothetical protein BWY80_01352 [Firmicutes bacterium ADurb.Bin456]|nr:MAG: hypothetical protein BWY80_01352 [Firmicutes bacterium ADurb.Bin456]